jgi:hypothetical protein
VYVCSGETTGFANPNPIESDIDTVNNFESEEEFVPGPRHAPTQRIAHVYPQQVCVTRAHHASKLTVCDSPCHRDNIS